MVDTPQDPAATGPQGVPAAQDSGHSHEEEHAQAAPPAMNPECVRQVTVEAPSDEVDRAYQAAVRRYRKLARIPGFRPGKVPEAVVRGKFAAELRQEVLEDLLPTHLQKALDAQGLRPVSQPQLTDLQLAEGRPLRFQAVFEVMPAIDISGHQQVKVERPDVTLTDAEFDAEIAHIREAHAIMAPVTEERPVADGDFVVVSYHGTVQDATEGDAGHTFEGTDVTIEVGSDKTLDAFNTALRGAAVGQQLQVEVAYPGDFGDAKLAGKTVAYDVTVKAIQKKLLPELNDDFAKQVGNYGSLEELQKDLRDGLAKEKQRRLESIAREKLVDALADHFSFPVPESLVQQQVDSRLERGLRALAAQGMTTEMMRQLDLERMRSSQRDTALKEVKGALVLDRIADLEQVAATDADVETHLTMLAHQLREPLEALRKRLTEDGALARIREQIRRDKMARLLYERMPA